MLSKANASTYRLEHSHILDGLGKAAYVYVFEPNVHHRIASEWKECERDVIKPRTGLEDSFFPLRSLVINKPSVL